MPDATATPAVASKTYLKATKKDGTVLVAAYEKLANIQKYAAQVFAKMNTFNVWRVVARVHPHSGEACLVRERVMISGDEIAEIQKVKPRSFESWRGDDEDTDTNRARYADAVLNLDPRAFENATEIQKGDGGVWTCPAENAPEAAVVGAAYPVHIDGQSLTRYVILKVATDDTPEIRFGIEANRATTAATVDDLIGDTVVDEGPTDGDDDVDDDELNRR